MKGKMFFWVIVGILGMVVAGRVEAADTEVILGDSAGGSAFSIKDSSSTEVLRIDSNGQVLTSLAGTVPGLGSGTYRLMSYPSLLLFRANASANNPNIWNASNLGAGSFASGIDTVASSVCAFAAGYSSTASGSFAVAMGKNTTASGDQSFAMGTNTTASGLHAVAMAYNTTASGSSAVAMGENTTASGGQAFAMGTNTTASAGNAVAMGHNTTASGSQSFAVGESTTANQGAAVAMGQSTTASGNNAVAMGESNTASGTRAFAMGISTTASGDTSLAIGTNAVASGSTAIALGSNVTASGNSSLALGGYSLTASANNAVVIGTGGGVDSRLTNSKSNSLMVGFNSISPNLYVGSNRVGINTWEVEGGSSLPGRLTIEDTTGGAVLLSLVSGGNDKNSIEDDSGARLTAAGTWTNASDISRKTNIADLNYGLPEVLKLRPVQFNWKENGKEDIGFIAQEVKEIIPEVVYGEEGSLSLSYGQLTAVLAKAIQEQQQEIKELKEEIARIKATK